MDWLGECLRQGQPQGMRWIPGVPEVLRYHGNLRYHGDRQRKHHSRRQNEGSYANSLLLELEMDHDNGLK